MMKINYKVKAAKGKSKDKEIGFTIVFYALNILAVPFSAIATFNGYKETTGGVFMAGVLAALTGVLFFALNYIIMERRKKGLPHFKQVLGYLIPLSISFIGNFTYFYGNQVESTLLKEDLTRYSKVFDNTYESSITSLKKSTGLKEFKMKLDASLSQLDNQINKQGNYNGYGSEAKKVWKDIKDLFKEFNNTTLTEPVEKKYERFEAATLDAYKAIEKSKMEDVNKIISYVDTLYFDVNKKVVKLKKESNSDLLKLEGEDLINELKASNDKIGDKTKAKVKDFKYENLESYKKVGAKNPIQTLENALKFENPVATVSSMFFSLVIDLITLVFIFLAIPYTKNKNKKGVRAPKTL